MEGEEGIGVGTGFARGEFAIFDGSVIGGEENEKVFLGPGGREMTNGEFTLGLL